VALVRDLLEQHPHQDVLLATHGSLLTLILNGFDDKFGYDFWRTLTFPDVYELTFRDGILTRVRRRWEEAA
jgi:2,3-bisphosphoglycerate-dependent phosphoglycerate mutase